MAKCTGMRCPMQVGYKVDECNHRDCPDRTEPITNADLIRSMSDQGLALCLYEIGYVGGWYSKKDVLEWLQQPAKEVIK